MRGDYMIAAVTRALSGHFGGNPPVANETMYQGEPPEVLFVQQLNVEHSPSGRDVFSRYYFFDVRYHPDDKKDTKNKRMTEIAEQLLECLALIQTDGQPIRAASMKTEVQDGVLHCFVDYPMRVITAKPEPPCMSVLEHRENMKE